MVKVNINILKSYDVRGVYPSELDEEAAFEIGKSFIKITGAKSVVICQDARISSPALFTALARGITAHGGKVIDIGQGPTELAYFALGNYDFDAAIMITASHNPKEYNGFKMMRKNGSNIEMVRGKDLLPEMSSSSLKESGEINIEKKDVWKDYLNHVLDFVDLSEIAPLKIIVDASNGVGGLAIDKIKDKLPVEIIPLNFKPDGNFPAHSPNPLEKGSVDEASEAIKSKKADFGIIFDADADRIFLVDENGVMVPADTVLIFLAKYFLEKNLGMAIAYNAVCSRAVPEFVERFGGMPKRTAVGFVNVREGLMKNNGIMGGELSGHYCFRDNWYMDSGVIAFLILLVIISKDGRRVSEITKEFSPYIKADTNFIVENKEVILEKIKEKYSDGDQDFLDGITVKYPDWWFNLRPSNTEPLLRLTIEADTEDLLKEKQKKLADAINK
jgi:phosphomannomutase